MAYAIYEWSSLSFVGLEIEWPRPKRGSINGLRKYLQELNVPAIDFQYPYARVTVTKYIYIIQPCAAAPQSSQY